MESNTLKPIPLIFLGLLLLGCDENSGPSSESKAVKAAENAASPRTPTSELPTPPARISLTAAEFHSELAEKGLGPVTPIPVSETVSKPEPPASSPELQFTRLAGGKDRYCGTLSAGPIRCWGKDPLLLAGNFIDVAVADEGYCGVELNGKLTCEKLTPPPGVFARIVASGKNYCAVSPGGEVRCFGAGATAPLGSQRVGYVTAGNTFACASDPTDRLVCWGPDAPILPIDPFRLKDVAAGSHFLCYLEEDGSPRCLGKGPRLPERTYAAVSAGYETVCGIAPDGTGQCFGRVEMQTKGPVRTFAVAEASVCAHRQDGRIECTGDDTEGQLVVPTEARLSHVKGEARAKSMPTPEKESPRVEAALWLEFLELFPSRDVPLAFDEKQTFDFGDRIPVKFAPLIGADPNRFRAGIGVKLDHQIVGVSLFDLEERVLLLHLYQERRLMRVHELLRWEQKADPVKDGTGGTQVVRRTATLQRSLITTGQTIEVMRLEGKEAVSYGKQKGDGTRERSSARCDVESTTYALRLLPDATTRKESEKSRPEVKTSDPSGCGTRLPFQREREE